jgi:hypothetical protein
VRDETIAAMAIAGTALVLLGAYLASRAERPLAPVRAPVFAERDAA